MRSSADDPASRPARDGAGRGWSAGPAGWAGADGPVGAVRRWLRAPVRAEQRNRTVDAAPEHLWRVITGLGGDRGWGSTTPVWRLRGALDRLIGGPGYRRSRRDPDRLAVGDPVDFWRVERVEDGTLLVLRAEMRMPGVARLELRVGTDTAGRTTYTQRTVFHPAGLLGQLYWFAELPLHLLVFGRMATVIATAAQRLDNDAERAPNRPQST